MDWVSLDKEDARRRQALRDDRSQLNLALRAQHLVHLEQQQQQQQQLPVIVADSVVGGSEQQQQQQQQQHRPQQHTTRETWSVHRTRIVSVRLDRSMCTVAAPFLLSAPSITPPLPHCPALFFLFFSPSFRSVTLRHAV